LAETRTEVKRALIWARIALTPTVSQEALESFVAKAKDAGFLRSAPDLSRLIENPYGPRCAHSDNRTGPGGTAG
jgi:hypothetical protein